MTATRQQIRQAAGHRLICGFHGTTFTPELKEILREVQPLGLILFARNIESPEQVAELLTEIKSYRQNDPILMSIDQEGGRVARLKKPATEWPPMRYLGNTQNLALAEQVGAALAREMRSIQIDLNYAPVLDVDTNPQNPIIGDRSFSRNAQEVAQMGAAMIRGMQRAGVAACGKHFPGHGDTDKDSHLELPTVSHERKRFEEIEWPPFQAAIQENVASMMTAHVLMPELDEHMPATLSPACMRILRHELKYNGVIISDDLEMHAVANAYAPEELTLLGAQADVDVFLACSKPEVILAAYRGLIVGVEEERISKSSMLQSEKRALNMRDTYYAPPVPASFRKQWLGCEEHRLLAERFFQLSS